MTSTLSPYGQLALNATLCGPIARYFAWRPSFREVALQIIEQQWQQRRIAGPDPAQLRLYRWLDNDGYRADPLADVLIERCCRPDALRLVSGQDFLSLQYGAEFPQAIATDVQSVATLLNECGPFLLEEYKRQIVAYWVRGRGGQPSPWNWLAGYQQEQCRRVVELERSSGALDSLEAATALMLALRPEASQRAEFENLDNTHVWLLSLDVNPQQWLDADLASAVLVERFIPEQKRTLVLLYTLSGRWYRFASRQALARMLAYGGGRWGVAPFNLHLFTSSESVFRSQARLLLEQQLMLIDTIAASITAADEDPVGDLTRRLDEATSLLQICEHSQQQSWQLYFSLLPAWLKAANVEERRAYGEALLELAFLQRSNGGQSFLDAVPSILEYARDQVRAAILVDHPQATDLDVEAVEVVNQRVIASGVAVGGDFVAAGGRETVRFSLAQFALENLTALRAGTVTVHLRDGRVAPDWLTLDYVKALVTRLDLGKAYPDLLRRALFDDPEALARRQALFIGQVRLQLPLLALEKKLRGQDGLTAAGVRLVNGVFRPVPGAPDVARLRPLSFIRQEGATPDIALNTYLIERFDIHSGPSVLYRPLHRQPLREFATRAAFFRALTEEPALQEDVLAQLDDGAMPIYAKGGFAQPHTVRYTAGAEFAVFEAPEPARIGEQALSGKVLEQLYRSCAEELLRRAEAQSVSNSENRWIGYQELGWLMFNALLPLLNGSVALSTWMLQVFADLQNDLRQKQPPESQLAIHLFNFSLLLITLPNAHRALELPSGMPEGNALAPVFPQLVREPVSSPSGVALSQLDFSWATADQRLSKVQRDALVHFQAHLAPEQLGMAVTEGPWAGLFFHDQRWWARLEDQVYQVQVGDEVRVVDTSGKPGPWLDRDAAGDWRIDAGVRLRGGMPLKGRIEQMRAAKRQRITELQNRQVEFLSERLALSLVIERDLDEIGGRKPPPAPLLSRYGDHLRVHSQLMKQVDENYVALNQLESQNNFNLEHSRYLFERVTNRTQLVQVLQSQLIESKAAAHVLQGRIADPQGSMEARNQSYEALMAECEKAKAIIEEAIATFDETRELCLQLGKVLPMGPGLVADYRRVRGSESSLLSWRSAEFSITAVLILGVERQSGSEVYEMVDLVRFALQMQLELSNAGVFTEGEHIAVLDGSVRSYAMAQEQMRTVAGLLVDDQSKRWLAGLGQSLQLLRQEAEEELAGLIRAQAGDSEEHAPPADRKQVVINTRSRGLVVARQRKTKAGKTETVVVEPLENNELARFEETAEPGIWQRVEPSQTPPTSPERPQPTVSLANLLKRSNRLLSESDRQIQKARVQARTATIAIEMEEILVNQARPLEQLAQQIESLLTADNGADNPSGGRNPALQAKALNDKAAAMREEGRQLRISIIKTQPPTISRVAYLKAQNEIAITRPKGREPTARRKGQDRDYLQEYVISNKAGEPLWYAHFHYASLEALPADFLVGHLKTREQRFDSGQCRLKMEQSSQKVIQIYRSQIDRPAAAKLFLGV